MFSNISEINTDIMAANIVLIVLFVILTAAISLVSVFLIGKYHALKNEETESVGSIKPIHVFFIILAVGIVVRLILTFTIKGYGPNYETAYDIAGRVVDGDGFTGFTSYRSFSPIIGYLYALFGGWGRSMGLVQADIAMQLFMKLPFLLADIALAGVIYALAVKYCNRYVAIAVSVLYFLNPLTFVMSSVWGSEMIILALALVVTFWFVLSKNMFGMCVAASVSCLVSSYAVFVVPVVGFYAVYSIVKSVINIVKAKPSFDSVMRDSAYSNVFYAPLCIIIGFALMYLLSLPAYYADGSVGLAEVYNRLFVMPFTSDSSAISHYTTNGLSIYTVITNNFASLGPQFNLVLFAVIFSAMTAVFTIVFYLMKHNRANLVLIASFMAFTAAVYMMGSNEWSLVPALVLTLPAYIATKDRRILKVFAATSLFVVINALLSLYCGGMISGDLITDADANNMAVAGGAVGVFSILLSVFTVLVHIYYAVAVLDITVAKRRKEFITDRTASFGECMGNWVRS